MPQSSIVHIIGAGLAGSEAAWQIAESGLSVIIHEMRPKIMTNAHHTANCAELVCSNSFRSDDSDYNAVGLLHDELRHCDSIIMQAADKHHVPAGAALAVDRDGFSQYVHHQITNHPNITIDDNEITTLPTDNTHHWVIATGPLTSNMLSQSIANHTGQENLAFFDAIAPIIYRDTIDFDIAWFQSRYDKGNAKDYINCPMTKQQYEAFINALKHGEYTQFVAENR